MTASPVTSDRPLSTKSAPGHFPYLDGIRGLASLYVVLHHAWQYQFGTILWHHGTRLPSWLMHATNWLAFGNIGVAVFIVLSGYCLTLPIAGTGGTLTKGFNVFVRRRARRLLPPYFAAIAISLLLIRFVPTMNQIMLRRWDQALPAFKADVLLSHVFLIHNLREDWAYKINYPLWTVATEWQIYFFFPLLLLPLYRRFGLLASLFIAFAVGVGSNFVLPTLQVAHPQYLGLFGLGMGAAFLQFDARLSSSPLRVRVPWLLLALASYIILAVHVTLKSGWLLTYPILFDGIVGFMMFSLLMGYDRSQQRHLPPQILTTILEAPIVVKLGKFSYSLYLTHAVVFALIDVIVSPLHLDTTPTLLLFLLVGSPLCVALAYLFHIVFERPFLNNRAEANCTR